MTIIKENQNTTKLISILKKSEKQYPPLNKQQEKDLINKYSNDRDTLNQLLFNHNIKLVFNIAKHYVSKTKSFDDLVQNGFRGLAEATKRFDITRDIKFITYASQWIRKYILAEFYGNTAELDKVSFSLDSPLSYNNSIKNDNDTSSTVENIIHENIEASININDYKDEHLKVEYKDIYNALTTSVSLSTELSTNEKNMFTDIFYNQEKTRDIATKYNIDSKTVLAIKNKLINFCKNVLQTKMGIYSKEDLFGY